MVASAGSYTVWSSVSELPVYDSILRPNVRMSYETKSEMKIAGKKEVLQTHLVHFGHFQTIGAKDFAPGSIILIFLSLFLRRLFSDFGM